MRSENGEKAFQPMNLRLALQLACPRTWVASACPALFGGGNCAVKGADSAEDYVESSDSTLVYEDINPKNALWLAVFFLAAGAVLGLLCCKGAVPLLIGAVGGAVVLLYSAGPLPISYLPWGG